MTLNRLFDVNDIRGRYGLRDARAARRVIREAGGIEIAGRLYISAEDLARYEHGRALAPMPATHRASHRRGSLPDVTALPERWWDADARGA